MQEGVTLLQERDHRGVDNEQSLVDGSKGKKKS